MLIQTDDDIRKFLRRLVELGAKSFAGECSIQSSFQLADGGVLRFGWTDEDVAAEQGLWFDIVYPGNPNAYKTYKETAHETSQAGQETQRPS